MAAGEESGDLAQVMERLADYIEERNALRGKILTAFIYPAVVGVVSIGIVIFLLGYVVPQVVSAFSQARQDLPALTRAMLQASDFVRAWGWLCAGAIGGAYWGWRLYLRDPQARLGWHRRVLRLPLLGRFVLGVNTARFASTLAILGSAGVPLLRALDAARQTLANDCLAQAVEEATAQVREGVSLASALRTRQVFPPILTHLIASGEKTGALPPMLDRAAQTLSRDIERRAMGMTALLEPLMIVVMGGVVLTIVMAVLMPIIEMNQLVSSPYLNKPFRAGRLTARGYPPWGWGVSAVFRREVSADNAAGVIRPTGGACASRPSSRCHQPVWPLARARVHVSARLPRGRAMAVAGWPPGGARGTS